MGIRSQNNPIAAYLDVFSNTGTDASAATGGGGGGGSGGTPQGLTATGGIISDYIDGPNVYRAHIFNNTGTFDVSSLSPDPSTVPNTVDYLIVVGGGGGGCRGGGGGAGGLRSTVSNTGGGGSIDAAITAQKG